MNVVAKLDTRVLDRMIATHQEEASKVVRKGAEALQGEVTNKISEIKLVDTGALKGSIKAEEHTGPLNWWVHDGVDYGVFWELGFHQMVFGKFQMLAISQRPFMVPSVEKIRPQWNKHWREFFKRWV